MFVEKYQVDEVKRLHKAILGVNVLSEQVEQEKVNEKYQVDEVKRLHKAILGVNVLSEQKKVK